MEKTREQKLQKLLNEYRAMEPEEKIKSRYMIFGDINDIMIRIFEDEVSARSLTHLLLNTNYNLSDIHNILHCKLFMVSLNNFKSLSYPEYGDTAVVTMSDGNKYVINSVNEYKNGILLIDVKNNVENTFFQYYDMIAFYSTILSASPYAIIRMFYNFLNTITRNNDTYNIFIQSMKLTHEEFQRYFEYIDKEFAIRVQFPLRIDMSKITDFLALRDRAVYDLDIGNDIAIDMIAEEAKEVFSKLIDDDRVVNLLSNLYACMPRFDITSVIDISPSYNYTLTFESIEKGIIRINEFEGVSLLLVDDHYCRRHTLFKSDYYYFSSTTGNDTEPIRFNDCFAISSKIKLNLRDIKIKFFNELNDCILEKPGYLGYPKRIIYKDGPVTKRGLNRFMKILEADISNS